MSLYKLKGGKIWYFDFRHNGKRHSGSTRQTSKAKARLFEAKKREAARSEALQPKIRDIPFLSLAEEYLSLHVAPKKAKAYFQQRVKHLVGVFGRKRLSEITSKMIARFQAERAVGVSPATVNRDLAVLKGMFTKAIEWGYAAHNPAKKVKMLREDGRRERFLTKEEADRLLNACSSWLRPIVTVALHTGMRKGEILGLSWRDVDFRAGVLILDPGATKSGYGRKIPMNQTVRSTLEKRRAARVVKGLDAPVFVGPAGGDPHMTLRREFAGAIKRARLDGFRFHDLRHSHASFLVQAGVPLNTVRDLLGHRSLAMTLRYAHLSPEERVTAVGMLDCL